MRKLSFLLAIGIAGLLTACNNNEGGLSATAKKNIAINDSISKAFETGDFSKMGDYIAADAVDHGGENGDVKGLDNIVAEFKRYRAMMPDMKSSNSLSLANDEYVFTRATVTGTMNGKQTTMTSVDVARFKDGKAVEHWVYMDPKEMMAMMPPPPTPVNPADTATAKK